MNHELEVEREKMNHESRKMNHELELRKISLEMKKLEVGQGNRCNNGRFDVTKNVRLVPPFDEENVERFFQCFENVAEGCEWPKDSWSLLMFGVLKGKAQDAYSSLSRDDCKNYDMVKEAILKAYELVPEAYRQKFRHCRKKENETHVEFAHKKEIYFNRWCLSNGVDDFENLKQLVLIEEFKRCVHEDIKVYLDEKNVTTLRGVAKLADDYALTHKLKLFKSLSVNPSPSSEYPHRMQSNRKSNTDFYNRNSSGMRHGDRPRSFGPTCRYCKKSGHVLSDCWTLKRKKERENSSPNLLVSSLKMSGDSAISYNNVGDQRTLVRKNYLPFVSEGSVSLHESGENPVPIQILRDTGASQSLLVQNTLPFSDESATGDTILAQSIEGRYVNVPLHKVFLKSGFVSGLVTVGLRPTIPVEGIALLLGNDLAGG